MDTKETKITMELHEYYRLENLEKENKKLKKELDKKTVFLERRETYYGLGNVNVKILARYEGEQKVINQLTININKLLNRNIFQRIFNTGVWK